jgi:hypothetical protein
MDSEIRDPAQGLNLQIQPINIKLIHTPPIQNISGCFIHTGIDMTELLVLALILAGLFSLGFYLGNQFGRSAHIREDIQRARENNLITRIQNN